MLTLIVAMDQAKGIGLKGQLPWHLKQDLQLFKANTWDGNVVMGQTTYQHLPRRLEHRCFFVASLDPSFRPDPEVTVVGDLLAFLRSHLDDREEYFICGGASIYRMAYPYCRRALVSLVEGVHEVDTRFESFDMDDWQVDRQMPYEGFTYLELTRKEQ
mgnify:CR=1 FL=1